MQQEHAQLLTNHWEKYMKYNVLQGRDCGKKIHAGQLTWIQIMKPKLVGKVFIVEFWWPFWQVVSVIGQSQGATMGVMNHYPG